MANNNTNFIKINGRIINVNNITFVTRDQSREYGNGYRIHFIGGDCIHVDTIPDFLNPEIATSAITSTTTSATNNFAIIVAKVRNAVTDYNHRSICSKFNVIIDDSNDIIIKYTERCKMIISNSGYIREDTLLDTDSANQLRKEINNILMGC